MESHFYWISAFTYAVVLGIILFSDTTASKQTLKLEKSYREMYLWVIFFCLQDAIWGLCEAEFIKNDAIFFASSCVFHISTVITTFFWLKYVLDYLGDKVKFKRVYLALDIIVIFCELLFIIVNCFSTTLFKIVDGKYVTGPFRPLTFVNQYAVYLITGLAALTFAIKRETKNFGNYKTVFIFTLAPILLGVCQLLYPDAPFYSMGYFLGCFIIHIFIVAHDREVYLSEEEKFQRILELNDELKCKQSEIDGQFNILKSISGAFNYINLVDFETNCAYRFDTKEAEKESFDLVYDPHTSLNKKLAPNIDPKSYDRFWEYTDLSTLDEKMKGKRLISSEFKYTNGDWISSMYIRVGDNVNEPVRKVAYALRNITSDRKREEQVYSALTHLVYSLHIFNLENDTVERLIESDILKQIVGNEERAQKMARDIINATCKTEFLDIMLDFVDFSTVSERIKGKKILTCEFLGKYHGWTKMTFIPIETNGDKIKKLVVTTEIIDSEKSELIRLIYKSSTDELTRLYNRRMYEDELEGITNSKDMDNLVIVAMDINGLKTINDTIGHKAGDELIIGAGQCISLAFNPVGKVFRTGGDEFMAILKCDKDKISEYFSKFDEKVQEWTGTMVKNLSISYGYVRAEDYPELNVRDLASEADKKMYEAKSEHYRRSGIDRRRT